MEALRSKAAGVAGEGEAGTGDLGIRDLAIEPDRPGQRLELERVIWPLQEVTQAKYQPSAASARRARRRPDTVSSWRLRRSSARSSAVR